MVEGYMRSNCESCGVICPSHIHLSFRHSCSTSQCHRYILEIRDSPKAHRDTATPTPVHLLRRRQPIRGMLPALRKPRPQLRSRRSTSHTRRRRQDPDPDPPLENQLPRTTRPSDPTSYRARSPSLARVGLYTSREGVVMMRGA